MHIDIKLDAIIIGGGIAGLWLLNTLNNKGYCAILLEQEELGCKQTIASQGMIHGGMKYALGGVLNGAAEAIAQMPNYWRNCLAGMGDVDLSCEPINGKHPAVLSENFYLCSTGGLLSRVNSFFASKALRGRIDKITDKHDIPQLLQHKNFNGAVYKLIDLVLDVPVLLNILAQKYADKIFKIDWNFAQLEQSDDNIKLCWQHSNTTYIINAKRLILTAGAGNEQLLQMLHYEQPKMQLRPLQQVMVSHPNVLPFYGHFMGDNPSPKLSISTHKKADGSLVWYLGGDLATDNATVSAHILIEKARKLLHELLPWLDLTGAAFSTLRIDRAEPQQQGLLKPDHAFAEFAGNSSNVIVAWPTKLTLAPDMSERVLRLMPEKLNISNDILAILQALPKPAVGTPYWDNIDPI